MSVHTLTPRATNADATNPDAVENTATDAATHTEISTAHFTAPATGPARVFHQIRTRPGITRTRLHTDLHLSQPTVTRHVAALIESGLVEQASPTRTGNTSVGRPGAPLVPAGRHLTALGAHVGLHTTQLVAVDGVGRPLRTRTLRLPLDTLSPDDALEAVMHGLTSLGRGLPGVLGAGIAFSSPVDADGHITSAAYGWDGVHVADILGGLTQGLRAGGGTGAPFPISLATGVGAMAGAELSSTPLGDDSPNLTPRRSTLYIYAREVIAHSWIVGDAVHQPFTGVSPHIFTRIAESGSFASPPDGTGHPLGTTAVLQAARRRGLPAQSVAELLAMANHPVSPNPVARELLDERAELLGQIVALAVEVVDPATVVFAGDAFTADPDAVKIIARHLRRGDLPRQLRLQRAGTGIVSRAAVVTALHRLWSDPLS